MSDKPNQYNRLLLKLSGEALMGSGDGGIDVATLDRLAAEAKSIVDTGVQLCLVVGGGNIYRGISGSAQGMDRATADYMGMLATVMNALALQNAITRAGGEARVQSAIPMPTVCEPYARPRALRHLEKDRIVIFAAGTGNPYFTTDTAAALRAAEMGCDAIIKATMVDGVYSADPKTNPDATRYERLTYTQVLRDGLGVMDAAAIAIARDNEIPIIVLSLRDEGNILRVVQGGGRSSIVEKDTSTDSAAG